MAKQMIVLCGEIRTDVLKLLKEAVKAKLTVWSKLRDIESIYGVDIDALETDFIDACASEGGVKMEDVDRLTKHVEEQEESDG